jgi:Zn-dependent peptidase ImmA (M78 family)/DNA-binding XRE family transcriptional regulator
MKEQFARKLFTARKIAGLSTPELAEKVNLSKQSISKYETGLMLPSSATVEALAEVLNVSIDYFFTNEPNESILKHLKFREEFKHDQDEIEKIKRQTISILEKYLEAENIAEQEISFKNPIEDIKIRENKDVDKAVHIIRKKWKIGNAPIKNVCDFLEKQGIKVIEVKSSVYFEGFSTYAGQIPVIVININIEETTRRRFTTLHELGHLILEIDEDLNYNQVEKLCNYFAGILILPNEIIFETFSGRSHILVKDLITLKETYGISIQAIFFSGVKLGLWSNRIFEQWEQLNQNGGISTGKYLEEERPKRFKTLILFCLKEGKITLSKAASLMNKSIDEVLQIDKSELSFKK